MQAEAQALDTRPARMAIEVAMTACGRCALEVA